MAKKKLTRRKSMSEATAFGFIGVSVLLFSAFNPASASIFAVVFLLSFSAYKYFKK